LKTGYKMTPYDPNLLKDLSLYHANPYPTSPYSENKLQSLSYPGLNEYPFSVSAQNIESIRRQPLRVSHIGPSFVCAGVESWLRALSSHCDSRVLRFVQNVVTEDYAVDHGLLQQLGIPFSFGRESAVREAVMKSDVVLVWGSVSPEYLRPAQSTAKVIFVAHGVGDWTRSALATCSPAVDHVVAVSNIVKDSIETALPTSVILNGVDQRHIASRSSASEMRKKLGFSDSDFVVGFVGRFSPEKQAHLVVEAVSSMPSDTKLLLLGWGALRYQLMDLCNELIPGRFAFATSRDFMGDYYQIMNAMCMPSSEEGFGLVAAEAMLHSVPVVSTSVGVAHDLFEHRINGLIARPEEICTNLSLLRNNPGWAQGVGDEGRRSALKHCLASTMANRYQALLLSMTDGSVTKDR